MKLLTILFGLLTFFYGISGLPMMFNKGMGYFIYALFLEMLFIALFIFFLNKYIHSDKWEQDKAKSAKKREDKRKAQEDWKAGAPERERIRKEEKARKLENKRLRTTVVATRLIGEGAAEYKKSVGSVATRGAVGGFFAGPAGAVIGMATAKNKNTNKNVRRFLVKYLDGHIEEREATIGSSDYKVYMAHLEWEE